MTGSRLSWLSALLLLGCAGLSGCTQLFFYPLREEVQSPDQLKLAWEDVYLPQGQHGWYLKAAEPRGTILYFHGNGENISTFIGAVWWLPAQGYNVFLLEYSGYGKSPGSATVDAVHRDAEQALQYLLARGGVDRERLIVFGQSLGGSVALYTVAHSPNRDKVKAVIAEGAFSGYRNIAKEKMRGIWLLSWLRWPLSYLFNDDYSAEASITQLPEIPLLLIHGDRDDVVPYWHVQRLYERAQQPKELWTVEGGKHIDALTRPEYRTRLVEWLDAVPPSAITTLIGKR